MAIMGQAPQQDQKEKILAVMQFVAKLPLIVLAIIAAAMASWLCFWFIVRLCLYVYQTWLSEPWN